MITEGTYGGRFHDPIEDTRGQLAQLIADTYERQGVLIIPAFAVGRTQDVVYDIQLLVSENRIPDIPVYVDSPLATNVTEIFRLHPECYDEEILEYINTDPDGNAFGWPRLRYVRTADESKALNDSKQTCVIIAASGMCEAGRVLHHLKHHIGDPRHHRPVRRLSGREYIGAQDSGRQRDRQDLRPRAVEREPHLRGVLRLRETLEAPCLRREPLASRKMSYLPYEKF